MVFHEGAGTTARLEPMWNLNALDAFGRLLIGSTCFDLAAHRADRGTLPAEKLTDARVGGLEIGDKPQVDYWDRIVPGLVLRVSAGRKTWLCNASAMPGLLNTRKMGWLTGFEPAASRADTWRSVYP